MELHDRTSNITTKILENLVEQSGKLAEEVTNLLNASPANTDLLQARVKQFQGLLQMLELSSGTRLVMEMLQTLDSFKASPEKITENANLFQECVAILLRLMCNLNRIDVDTPCLFLPEIARLRGLLGKPPAYEYQLLNDQDWPKDSHLQEFSPPSSKVYEPLKRLRHLYQLGLLDIIQGRNRVKALTLLARVAERLGQFLTSENEVKYWSLVARVLSAFASGELQLRSDRVRLLSVVDRQIKALTSPGIPGAKSPYPVGLWAAFGALLVMTRVKGEADSNLRLSLGLPPLDFTDADVQCARARLVTGGEESGRERLETLKLQLNTLQSLLTLLDNEPAFSADDFSQFRQSLDHISLTCQRLELTTARDRFASHFAEFSGDTEYGVPLSVELMRKITESVLYLECLLLDCQSQQQLTADELKNINLREVDQVIESNLMKSGLNAVWTECLSQLTAAKEYLDDIDSGLSGNESVPELVSVFDRIRGAAILVGDTRVVDVAWRCSDFVRKGLLDKEPVTPRDARLATFADAVIGLEYHFENCVSGNVGDERPLNVADEYLASLGA